MKDENVWHKPSLLEICWRYIKYWCGGPLPYPYPLTRAQKEYKP
jgi:hypothetical protein